MAPGPLRSCNAGNAHLRIVPDGHCQIAGEAYNRRFQACLFQLLWAGPAIGRAFGYCLSDANGAGPLTGLTYQPKSSPND